MFSVWCSIVNDLSSMFKFKFWVVSCWLIQIPNRFSHKNHKRKWENHSHKTVVSRRRPASCRVFISGLSTRLRVVYKLGYLTKSRARAPQKKSCSSVANFVSLSIDGVMGYWFSSTPFGTIQTGKEGNRKGVNPVPVGSSSGKSGARPTSWRTRISTWGLIEFARGLEVGKFLENGGSL